ncbi:RNase H domain-containing protein [Abeliophyllum distichum]|uniref:RNase H domain-containing protein n=1 Tax=Abeliophyllum distichum TaxID=126358 RepID=A0ABD1UGC0_9LAMI
MTIWELSERINERMGTIATKKKLNGNDIVTKVTKPIPGNKDTTVDQLIVADENMWDFNILVDLFNEEDRRQIMNIPLTAYGSEDRILWIHDKKWAIWMNQNEAFWKGESYTVSKVVTIAKNLYQQWHDANQPLTLPTSTPTTPKNDKWKPPTTGSFKLNIDAAIFENQGKAGLGLVI